MKSHKQSSQITAIIDADILIYQAALEAETNINWGDDAESRTADPEAAERIFRRLVDDVASAVFADIVILCVTDGTNWRTTILPSYKANRDPEKKPLLVNHLRDYAVEQMEAYRRPGLEGDDCCGILATCGKFPNPVMCTIDKDFKTVPGEHYNIDKKLRFTVTEAEADHFHLVQTLAGDTTDFYKGCPGMGMLTADKLLKDDLGPWVSYVHEFSRGARKGEVETRWDRLPHSEGLSQWEKVVSCYLKAGLTEADALTQARVARICRASDYDFHKKQVILWSPE